MISCVNSCSANDWTYYCSLQSKSSIFPIFISERKLLNITWNELHSTGLDDLLSVVAFEPSEPPVFCYRLTPSISVLSGFGSFQIMGCTYVQEPHPLDLLGLTADILFRRSNDSQAASVRGSNGCVETQCATGRRPEEVTRESATVLDGGHRVVLYCVAELLLLYFKSQRQ